MKLRLSNAPGSPRQHNIHRITSSWSESTVNWNTQPSFAALTASVNTGTSATFLTWDVTADVNAFLAGSAINYGWLVKDNAEDGTNGSTFQTSYVTKEGTDVNRPQLSITFTAPANLAGFNSPSAQAAVTSGSGDNNGYQTNPSNAFSADETFAVDTNSGATNNSDCSGTGVDRHIFSSYNLSVPAGATINGLELRQDLKVNSLADSPFTCIQLSWDGGTTWTSIKQTSLTSTNLTPYYFGSATDTWGRTWNSSDFSNANFRVRVANADTDNSGSTTDFSLDWIPVRVYYTPDTTAPTVASVDSDGQTYNITTVSPRTIKVAFNEDITNTATIAVNGSAQTVNDCGDADAKTFCFIYTIPSSTDATTETIAISGAQDVAANTMVADSSHTFIVDTTAPTVTPVTPVPIYTNNPQPQHTFNSSEAGTFSVGGDCSSPSDNAVVAGLNTITLDSDGSGTDLDDGTYSNCTVTVTDAAGNKSSDLSISTFTVDTINPTAPGNPTTTSPTNDNTPTWTWDAASDTNLDHYIFFWDTFLGGEINNSGNIGVGTTSFNHSLSLLDGSWYSKVKAYDAANNTSVSGNGSVVVDTIAPTAPVATPGAGDYMSDQSVTLASSDSGGSGLGNIYYTTNGTTPSNTNGTIYSGPITVDKDMTVKAIAYDNAGNASSVLTAIYGIAPVISAETSSTVTSSSITITWTTDDSATSRVIYDAVPHPVLGAAPNYGYASSTVEDPTKVTSHSVNVTGLSAGTTYFYRSVSHGSPEAVGSENSVTTAAVLAATTGGGGGGDGGDGLGCAVHDCSGGNPAPQNLVLRVSTPGPSSAVGFAPGVLGVSTQEASPSAEVKGESATSEVQPSATIEPQGKAGLPINTRTVLIVVTLLLLGFGAYRFIIK